ncbi:MAG: transcriptional repressor [Clostridia bacterium]|nr:transcriptional repressor [Clostridia bacterium]
MAYKTKQSEAILEYMEGRKGQYVTAAELTAYFKGQRQAVSETTVYRQLERLTNQGVLHKYSIEGRGCACYKLAHKEEPFLLQCEKCGDLVRFRCKDLEKVYQHFNEAHSFRINPHKTVFYGCCDKCREVRA